MLEVVVIYLQYYVEFLVYRSILKTAILREIHKINHMSGSVIPVA